MRTIWLLPGWFGFVVGPLPSGQENRSNIQSAVKSRLADVMAQLTIWAERSHQRRQLADVDERMMRDMGLHEADIQRERSKRFWQH